MTLMLAALLLTSCAQTPDSVKSNNSKIDEDKKSSEYIDTDDDDSRTFEYNVSKNGKYKMTDVKNAWSDTDAAYKTSYSKFKLPDKSALTHRDFDELYNATIKYSHYKDDDVEWLEPLFPKFEQLFDLADSVTPEVKDAVYSYNENSIGLTLSSLGSNYTNNKMIGKSAFEYRNSEINLYLMDQNKIPDGKNYSKNLNTAQKLEDDVYSLLEDDLDHYPKFVQSYDDNYYSIYFQPYYKNVGIENVVANISYVDEDYNGEDKENVSGVATQMQSHVVFYKNELQAFYGSTFYKVADEQKIDKIISFKTACDILEKKLSSKMNLKFDDVELWYQPKGKSVNTSMKDNGLTDDDKYITLTPKWYFIINDSSDTSGLLTYYISVDCQSGEVKVLLPGNR